MNRNSIFVMNYGKRSKELFVKPGKATKFNTMTPFFLYRNLCYDCCCCLVIVSLTFAQVVLGDADSQVVLGFIEWLYNFLLIKLQENVSDKAEKYFYLALKVVLHKNKNFAIYIEIWFLKVHISRLFSCIPILENYTHPSIYPCVGPSVHASIICPSIVLLAELFVLFCCYQPIYSSFLPSI